MWLADHHGGDGEPRLLTHHLRDPQPLQVPLDVAPVQRVTRAPIEVGSQAGEHSGSISEVLVRNNHCGHDEVIARLGGTGALPGLVDERMQPCIWHGGNDTGTTRQG